MYRYYEKYFKPYYKHEYSLFILLVFFLIFGVYLNPLFIAPIIFSYIISYLLYNRDIDRTKYFLMSLMLTTCWIYLGRSEYDYNHIMPSIMGINLFPFFAWSAGMFLVYQFSEYISNWLESRSFYKKMVLFLVLYWVILISAEYIGYYYLNIQNIPTSVYSGLPICDCLHAPRYMQAVYFLMGPLYFGFCEVFKWQKRI